MRKAAYGVLMLGVGLAGPAWALEPVDGGHTDVDAHIDWNKSVNVDEVLYVEKALFIKAIAKIPTPGGGEAAAIANVGNAKGFYSNTVLTLFDQIDGHGIYGTASLAKIDDAVNNNNGVMQVNQDSGVMSNQGNLLAISDTGPATGLGDSQAEVSQANHGNTILREYLANSFIVGVIGHFGVERDAEMTNAANANLGIVNINQNAGELNNQTNANAVGVGTLGVVIMGESALGQATAENQVSTFLAQHSSTIQDSINNNIAQTSVNQASGGGNNQSSTFNFSALLSFSTPGISQLKF